MLIAPSFQKSSLIVDQFQGNCYAAFGLSDLSHNFKLVQLNGQPPVTGPLKPLNDLFMGQEPTVHVYL